MQSAVSPRGSTFDQDGNSSNNLSILNGRPLGTKDAGQRLSSPVFAIKKSASAIDSSGPFSPLGPRAFNWNDPSEIGENRFSPPRSSLVRENSSHASMNSDSTDAISPGTRLSFDSAKAKPFQPASLPAPRTAGLTSNIWAQTISTSAASSSSVTDLDLHSPLIGQKTLIARRFSHLGSNAALKSPLVGSPSSLADFSGPSTLNITEYRGNLSPTSPLGRGSAPNSLPANFCEPWGDSNLSTLGSGDDERTGRSRARDILQKGYPESYRDPSVGSIGSPCSSSACSGIGLSNMSPFTGTSLLPPGGMSLGGAFGSNHHMDSYGRGNRTRDSSLGAIGTGRMNSRSSALAVGAIGTSLGLSQAGMSFNRGSEGSVAGSVGSPATDSWFMGGRSLSNDLDEDDELVPPTKSGATSRRHSVAAFTGRGLAQGFESINSRPSIPGSEKKIGGHLNNLPVGTDMATTESHPNGGMMFGSGSLALTDEDLLFTSDFNSLNLNLEAHAQQQKHNPSSFEFNHFNSTQPDHHIETSQPRTPRFNMGPIQPNSPLPMPWQNPPTTISQIPATPSAASGLESHGRRSSFSAGDPFSASAQASRYFASQADNSIMDLNNNPQTPLPRFPLGTSGPVNQASASLSGPSVTTFSNGGLLSTNPNQALHQIDVDPNKRSSAAFGLPGSPFDAFSPLSLYASQMAQPQSAGSPLVRPQSISGLSIQPALISSLQGASGPFSPTLTTPGPGPNELSDLGKGIPLHQLPRECRLYIVEFKAGRTDLFYFTSREGGEGLEKIQKGDLVIVEADRGKDLGKVIRDSLSVEDVQKFQNRQVELAFNHLTGNLLTPQTGVSDNLNGSSRPGSEAGPQSQLAGSNPASIARLTKEIHPKKIFGKATATDISISTTKAQDEAKALALCRSKALQRGLKMEITSAEWQWDRRKLTFFFIADKRIDFRDLVKDLFRTWKTRIWMCSVNP